MIEEIRQTDDLSVAPTDDAMFHQTVSAMPEGERTALAGNAFEAAQGQLKDKFEAFFKKAIAHAENLRQQYEIERENKQFSTRIQRNYRRIRNEPEVSKDAFKNPDPSQKDGHAELGLGMGWSRQAQATAKSYLYRKVFESSQRPVTFKARGSGYETQPLEDIFPEMFDYFFDGTRFKPTMRRVVASQTTHGYGVFTCEMIEPLMYERQGDSWREVRGAVKPEFTFWPVESVLFSNVSEPEIEKQEGIFLIANNATVHDLERGEATFDFYFDGDMFTPAIIRKRGTFFNLNKLRDLEAEQPTIFDPNNKSNEIQPFDDRKVSTLPPFDAVRYSGALPIYYWIMNGDFTWEMARALGPDMNVGMPAFDPEDKMALKEFARRMSRVSRFVFTYAKFHGNGPQKNDTVIQMGIAPSGQHGVFKIDYELIPDEGTGRSIVDLGYRIEDAADMINNARVRIAHMNANPAWIADPSLLESQEMDEVIRLIKPNQWLRKRQGAQLKDILEKMEFNTPFDLERAIQQLKPEFEGSVKVTAAARGDSSGVDTATQAQLDASQSQALMDDIALGTSNEVLRLVKYVFEEAWRISGAEGFYDIARKVAGHKAANISDYLRDMKLVWDGLAIESPLTVGRDPAVLGVGILNGMKAMPGIVDPFKAARVYFESIGVVHPEEILADGLMPLEPDEEHEMMSVGRIVQPNPGENFLQHLAAHISLVQQIEAGQIFLPPEQLQPFYMGLIEHINRTQIMMEKMQMMLAAQLGANGPSGPGGEGGQQNGKPASEQKKGQDANAQANRVPGSGLGLPGGGL